ncbi:54S ribosomal protein L12, mitochondrial [Leucoagaricus gongylophorus]
MNMAVSLFVQFVTCVVHESFRAPMFYVYSLGRLLSQSHRSHWDRLLTVNSPSDSWSRLLTHSRYLATAAVESSRTSTSSATSNDPLINRIVDDISKLTLLQAADLVTLLKSRLNIQEIALPAAPASPIDSASAAPEETAAEKPQEKTVFNVILKSFDTGAKPKIIKEVKSLVPNLTLIEAKKFVEAVPKMLKENLSKEEAEKLQKAFQSIGGDVTLE